MNSLSDWSATVESLAQASRKREDDEVNFARSQQLNEFAKLTMLENDALVDALIELTGTRSSNVRMNVIIGERQEWAADEIKMRLNRDEE